MTRRPYGLICPISLACEILEPRWTIQILTELWNGSTRFNDIRKGLGRISPIEFERRHSMNYERAVTHRPARSAAREAPRAQPVDNRL